MLISLQTLSIILMKKFSSFQNMTMLTSENIYDNGLSIRELVSPYFEQSVILVSGQ